MADVQGPHLTECDREPIHIPGAVQAFGALLALHEEDLTIVQASANAEEMLGVGTGELSGQPLAQLLSATSLEALGDTLARADLTEPRSLALHFLGSDRPFYGRIHRNPEYLILEIEPLSSPGEGEGGRDSLAEVRAVIGTLERVRGLQEYCRAVVREVRRLTGYDRVMVYRFDLDWHGEVIAEEGPGPEPLYLGLHFPASDIPAPARQLYRLNPVRYIPDTGSRPSPLVPDQNAPTRKPVDLGRAVLRAVSPVHLEYLHNMGVRSSLSFRLLREGKLWGLIACHHPTPRHLPPSLREGCELLSQVISLQLGSRVEEADQAYREDLRQVLDRLGDRARRAAHYADGLVQVPQDLLRLVAAQGAAVWRGGHFTGLGNTPPGDFFPGLVGWLNQAGQNVFATDRLPDLYPPARAVAPLASGLLSLTVSRQPDVYLLFFRGEVIREVNWGGDPAKAAVRHASDGRIHPRNSFALWKEELRNRSLPWRQEELEQAVRLREVVAGAAAALAENLESLLPICAWCKKIRNDQNYWQQVEDYLGQREGLRFTHGICPDCLRKATGQVSGPGA